MLTDSERIKLLAVARGAFVTLHLRGELRGCIGYVEAEEALIEVVARAAVKAATQDPRFSPVGIEELEELEIEISAMTPVTPVTDPEKIRVGVHGLIVELGRKRGLLLPQVPEEYGWTREEFLGHTAEKAGLPMEAWRDPLAKLFWFEAEVFDRNGVHHAP
jgi:AmmeMemoRadiSam system protein A